MSAGQTVGQLALHFFSTPLLKPNSIFDSIIIAATEKLFYFLDCLFQQIYILGV
jgi:hypothetical protein